MVLFSADGSSAYLSLNHGSTQISDDEAKQIVLKARAILERCGWNGLLARETGYVSKIDIFTIKKFSDLFYLYISENSMFENIIQIIRMNSNNINTNNMFIWDNQNNQF